MNRKGGSVKQSVKSLLGNPYIRFSISLIILGFLFYHLPLRQLWHTIRNVPFTVWLFTVAVFVLGHIFGTVKWHLLINTGSHRVPFIVALRCYFAGLFANLFLPSLAGGDVVRAGLAIRYTKEKTAIIFGGVLDRFLDTASLGAIILVGAYFAPTAFSDSDQRILSFLFLFLSALAILGLTVLAIPTGWVPGVLQSPIRQTQKIIRELIKTPWKAILAFAIALLMQTTFVAINAFLGKMCGIHLPFAVWLLVWPLAKLSALLPISMGGLGVREAALAALLARLNIPMALSVGLGLLWETVLVTGGALGGIFYVVMNKTSTPLQSLLSAASVPPKDKIANPQKT